MTGMKDDDYAPDRYVDAAIEKLATALFEGKISGCEYPLKTDEAERDVMMRGIVNDAITFERHLVAKEKLEEYDFSSGFKPPPVGLRVNVARAGITRERQHVGRYTDRRVFARAPKFFRKYDERGVELVWHLQRALYGGPDSGRVWYNTFAHFLMKEDQITPFQRCHHEPCTFTHFLDGQTDANGAPKRIICSVYVDDGRTWDNCVDVCDGFYERLRQRFSITMDAGTHFMIGMDISFGDGWLKICSSTYINNMPAMRFRPHGPTMAPSNQRSSTARRRQASVSRTQTVCL